MRVPFKAVILALAMLFGGLFSSLPSNAQGFATGGIVVRDGDGRYGRGFQGRHDGVRRDGRHDRGGRYHERPRFHGDQRSYRERRYHDDRRYYSDRRYYGGRRFHERGYHGRDHRRSGGSVVIRLR